ncbi:MAG TPA: molybdate ABC transporter substrate-binding protein [Bacillota bacterium]|nr:molybdate ABC transporter substrate-binding protein [Bacillota bacterium]
MKHIQKRLFISLVITILLFSTACGKVVPEPEVSLTISAAASLKGAMEEVKAAYAEEKPNVILTCNFGSSGSLQQQIEQGAEVDVFFSAAAKQMDALQEKGLIVEDTRKNILENKIVLIVPKDVTSVTDFNDLTSDNVKKIALGETKSVPVGQYSEEVLKKLNLMDTIESKVVFGKDVKEVLTWVETGNADAGMVYETDSITSEKVRVVAYAPEGSHKPVVYPAAVIKDSKNIDASKNFMSFLCSEKAKSIFEKYGFAFIIK